MGRVKSLPSHPRSVHLLAQVKVEGGATVPVQPDGTVAKYSGGGAEVTPFAPDSSEWVDVLPWWIDGRHWGWAPKTPPRADQWADWAI